MNIVKKAFSSCLLVVMVMPYVTWAADGNWKTGRIYYRSVCTACHKDSGGGAISPATKTKAEWKTYVVADSHAGGKDKLSYYVSKEYRESIKETSRAARKLINVPADKLMADVQAFAIHGAKDSKTPARCN